MLDTIVSGLVQGNVYALMAVGISLIFGVTGVVNFPAPGRASASTWG